MLWARWDAPLLEPVTPSEMQQFKVIRIVGDKDTSPPCRCRKVDVVAGVRRQDPTSVDDIMTECAKEWRNIIRHILVEVEIGHAALGG